MLTNAIPPRQARLTGHNGALRLKMGHQKKVTRVCYRLPECIGLARESRSGLESMVRKGSCKG